jgi:serine O-acetyltransferase
MTAIAHAPGEDHGVDLRIVFDDARYAAQWKDAVAVDSAQPLPALLAEVELAVLRWLECRVERRYPEALVGKNPPAARLLQWVSQNQIPMAREFVQLLLNCDLQNRLRAPILMPHPYGIVIEPGAEIGNRVTIMQQATIGRARPGELGGAPVIEDNVYVGPGARILGGVRVGRGAIIGANAVVTRDVPSHCTVIGVNHVVGRPERRAVVNPRRVEQPTVVNS